MLDNQIPNADLEIRNAQSKEQDSVLFGFQTTQYLDFDRGLIWYALAVLLVGGLVFYSLLQYAWTFAALLLVFSGTYFAFLVQPLKLIPFEITNHNLRYGKKSFEFNQFSDFWVEYLPSNDQILHLHFESNKVDLKILLPKNLNTPNLELTLMQNIPHSRDKTASILDTICYLLRL